MIRWLNVVLRTAHLLAVVVLASYVLTDTGQGGEARRVAALVVASGLAMFVIDFLRNPDHLREVAGIGIVFKLAICIWMVLHPAILVPLFWSLLCISSLISHAPKNFRHHIWWPKRADVE